MSEVQAAEAGEQNDEVEAQQAETETPTPGERPETHTGDDDWQKRLKAAEAQAIAEKRKRQQYEQRLAQLEAQQSQHKDQDFDPFDRENIRREYQTLREQERQQELYDSYKRKLGAAKVEGVDLNEAEDNVGTQISVEVAKLIMAEDNPAEIIAHLHTNPDALSRIAGKSGAQAGYELGQVRAAIKSQQSAARRVTGAPDPIEPAETRTPSAKEWDSMTQSEREESLKKRYGGSVFPT